METSPHRPCYVYLLQAAGAVKIGVAVNIGARVQALQSGNPYPISIIGRRQFESAGIALEAERALHERFAGRRAQGEWFWITPRQACAALDHFNAEPRKVEGPPKPRPVFVSFDYDEQLRLSANAVFYDEAG